MIQFDKFITTKKSVGWVDKWNETIWLSIISVRIWNIWPLAPLYSLPAAEWGGWAGAGPLPEFLHNYQHFTNKRLISRYWLAAAHSTRCCTDIIIPCRSLCKRWERPPSIEHITSSYPLRSMLPRTLFACAREGRNPKFLKDPCPRNLLKLQHLFPPGWAILWNVF